VVGPDHLGPVSLETGPFLKASVQAATQTYQLAYQSSLNKRFSGALYNPRDPTESLIF